VQYAVSRVIVQRLCDERADIVPYLPRVIDSLERYRGLYHDRLAELVPLDVIGELNRWLAESDSSAVRSNGPDASLELLERIFLARPDEQSRRQS
jgi:hypothetical protein